MFIWNDDGAHIQQIDHQLFSDLELSNAWINQVKMVTQFNWS